MNIDYKKLGLKCGIEIHLHSLLRKGWRKHPSEIRDDEPHLTIKRKLRAVAGEVGDIDPAALHEFLRDKEIVYRAYSDTNCLLELDEEPPHPLNEEALDTVLEVSLLLNAKPIDELQVMRKTVIDGSNTSGFQRTILVAMDGSIDTNSGRVGIPTICLEEDAARKISEEGNTTTYRLDRLGIPLIEIGTSPDIKSPEQARETAEKLGMILRATGKVKRGIGTIRQDLNVSIKGGERIEAKGVQDLRLIAKVVRLEVERQLMLIEVAKELKKRKLSGGEIKPDFHDVTKVFKNTKSKLISSLLKNKNSKVIAVKLSKFSGLLKGKLGPELAQYAKAIAAAKGIFHSDELPGYGITQEGVDAVAKKLSLGKDDAFALVVETKETAEKALEAVLDRCRTALEGVPKETRRAKDDGTTEFMRPLPGSARMYPETDEPLIPITQEKILEIKKNLPKLPEERLEEFKKLGLSHELANQLVRSRFIKEFEEFTGKFKDIKPSLVATRLLATKKLELLETIELTAKVSLKDIEKDIDRIIEENIEFVRSKGEGAVGPLVGKAMAEFKGRVDGNEISRLVRKKIKLIK